MKSVKASKFIERRTPLRRKSKLFETAFVPRWGKRKSKKSPFLKVKVWKTSTADSNFSNYIRSRDGECLKCGTTENLTCSHYWRRALSSTRFDPDNCIALCLPCHMEWENLKNYEYKEFMVEWLGEEKYQELEKRSRTFMKREDAVLACMNFLKSL